MVHYVKLYVNANCIIIAMRIRIYRAYALACWLLAIYIYRYRHTCTCSLAIECIFVNKLAYACAHLRSLIMNMKISSLSGTCVCARMRMRTLSRSFIINIICISIYWYIGICIAHVESIRCWMDMPIAAGSHVHLKIDIRILCILCFTCASQNDIIIIIIYAYNRDRWSLIMMHIPELCVSHIVAFDCDT